MFVAVSVLMVAVCGLTSGHPFEASKPHYNSKYFSNSRIVGGVEAPEGYGKHMAALVYGYPWVMLICGGSIISQRHILTAAHCIDMVLNWKMELLPSFRAVIGSKRWSTTSSYIELQFLDYVRHSGWDSKTIKNDIGLLTVAEDISNSDSVKIIPLSFDWVDGGVQSYVTGWGSYSDMLAVPEKLQLLYVRTMWHKECNERVREATETLGPAPGVQEDIEICTLYSQGHGMCSGDSGSALVMEETQQQIGIVSWGFPCALGAPDVHVRMSGYKDWLTVNTRGYLG